MRLKKSIKYFLSSYTVRQDRTKYNGLIEVKMVFNMPRLIVNNMIQSGGMMRKIWDKGIKKLKRENKKIKKALILGLGGGDVAFRIEQYFPQIKVIGIEIDKKIIDMAYAYFNLHKLKNLKVENEDGAKYVRKTKNEFDLIIVDVFQGEKIPGKFKSKRFLNNLTKKLTKNGVVIYNHLFDKENKPKAGEFIKKLEGYFKKIYLQRVGVNLLIYAEVVK